MTSTAFIYVTSIVTFVLKDDSAQLQGKLSFRKIALQNIL